MLDPATGRQIAVGGRCQLRRMWTGRWPPRAPPSRRAPGTTCCRSQREALLWKLSDLIEKHADELAELESLDNGKTKFIASVVDVPSTRDYFRYMAGWATKLEGATFDTSISAGPGSKFHTYTLREPIGVVAQIIPWNFPLAMAAWKLGPALACGCTCVLKPAEQTPLSALRLGELITEAGFPPGVVNILTGNRRDHRRGAGGASGRRQGRLHRLDRRSASSSTSPPRTP